METTILQWGLYRGLYSDTGKYYRTHTTLNHPTPQTQIPPYAQVGYGDMAPTSHIGRAIGVLCFYTGRLSPWFMLQGVGLEVGFGV